MDTALFILQVVLGLAFVGLGLMHARAAGRPVTNPKMAWMEAVPTPYLRTIGTLEVLGGLGLILPWITGIAPWLTVLAAGCLALLMVAAAIFHSRRIGERPNIVVDAILGLLALVVFIGRVWVAPF